MEITNLTDRKQRRKPSVDVSSMVYGKLPPQAKEFEEAVLGAIMVEQYAIDKVSSILKPEYFYVDSHQLIFLAILHLVQKSEPIDILTVSEELRRNENLEKVGGAYAVMKLTNSVVSGANIETHSRIILEKFLQRDMIRICGETIGDAYEHGDAFEIINNHEKKLSDLTATYSRKKIEQIDSLLVKSVQRIEFLRNQDNHITGVPSGFMELDAITHGWQPTDLIVLAARPSVGKTAFALNLTRNAAMDEIKPTPVGFFSLEMNSNQLINRILSSESGVFLKNITNGRLDDEQMKNLYKRGIQKLAQAPIFIDDTAAINIIELRSKIRMLKLKHNIGLVIIDYLQLMSGVSDNRSNREQDVSKISRDLKGLAKELEIPIIALSQMSREVEKRKGEKTGQLSDLRESGAIEQDADMVMFMYRPEYYEIKGNDLGESVKGETRISIDKHRNGEIAKGDNAIRLMANLSIQKFTSWDKLTDVKQKLPEGNWRAVSNDFDEKDMFK